MAPMEEKGEEAPRVCPIKARKELARSNLLWILGDCKTGDKYCDPQCPRKANPKFLGLPLPEFVGSCPMEEMIERASYGPQG